MNKSKIEWCDYTWNPVTGCLHGCPYCYARRIAERFAPKLDNGKIADSKELHDIGDTNIPFSFGFDPTIYRNRLDEPIKLKRPSKIFVVSMGDLYGSWVPDEWINEVMKSIANAPHHVYMFLTKNPDRYYDYFEGAWQEIPEQYDFTKVKMMLGTTITNQNDVDKLSETSKDFIDFISIEPLLGEVDITEILYHMPCCSEEANLKWVIIGAQTGPGAVPPKPEWVQSIIDQCRAADVPVFLKDNLNWDKTIKEYPKGLEE